MTAVHWDAREESFSAPETVDVQLSLATISEMGGRFSTQRTRRTTAATRSGQSAGRAEGLHLDNFEVTDVVQDVRDVPEGGQRQPPSDLDDIVEDVIHFP